MRVINHIIIHFYITSTALFDIQEVYFVRLKRFFLDLLPTPLVWIIARPYVAGDSMQKALDKVDELWKNNHIMSTVDLLGEDVKTTDEVEQMLQFRSNQLL